LNVEKIKKWLPIGALIICFIVVITFLLISGKKEEEPPWEVATTEESLVETTESTKEVEETTIMVDVKGAVKKPGVYELKKEARLKEAILLAGGMKEEAEEKQLNLAKKLEDQEMIYVPTKEEAESMPDDFTQTQSDNETSSSDTLININTADLTQLQQLSGIGPSKAQAIIDYREENGAFKNVDELQEVSGFGQKTVEKLKESITI